MHWRIGAALILLSAPLHAAAPLDAGAVIDACIPRLDPELDVGYERVAARCPDLGRALEQSDFAQWLPEGWKETRNNLSAGSLVELRAVVARERATRSAAAHTPRVEHLGIVLATLGNRPAETPGVWSRFKRWLRDLTERTESADSRNWFDRMVGRMGVSDAMLEIIQFVALGALVLLAGYVAFNEFRAALVPGGRRRRRSSPELPESPDAQSLPGLGEIERAAPEFRPGMLLELICARLTALRRLPPATALTVRELTKSVRLHDARDTEELAELALTAERARFAAGGLPESTLLERVDRGRELLQRVESLAAAAPAEDRS